MQHMGVSAFPSRAALHAPGCSGGAALMWLQLLPWPPQCPRAVPGTWQQLSAQPAPASPGVPACPCASPSTLGLRGRGKGCTRVLELRGCRGRGLLAVPTPPPCALCRRRRFARCIRALCEQHNLGFLPSPLVLQSQQGPAGRWGLVEGLRGQGCRRGWGLVLLARTSGLHPSPAWG